MIIDCFTFFNELDLLEVRLAELNEYVDYFVLVEAGKTQSLLDKSFYFEENKERYLKFLNKIIHVKVEDYPNNQRDLWEMENHQRNCINRGLEQLNLNDNDIILVSDLDEIPKGLLIKKIKEENLLQKNEMFSIVQEFYAYFLNLKCETRDWIGTVVTKPSVIRDRTPQGVRVVKDYILRILNGGWHFSWLGGAEAVWEKAQSCIEPFDKKNLPSKEEYIDFFKKYTIINNKGFVKTEDLSMTDQKFSYVDINESFPLEIRRNIKKYNKYILNK
jgi:beta-1,4-mannosyl-glycoprotein beta-1,4-N-acetylglucosaminyltransferase